MDGVSLVPVGSGRLALTGVDLPSPPPTRVYISGQAYTIAPTSVPLPPLINTVKAVANWVGPGARIARNIWYFLKGSGGTGSTSDPAYLLALANALATAWNASAITTSYHTSWKLNNITCKDNGGTTAQATSTFGAISGSATGPVNPPQTAVCLSWKIVDSYRGGKPRTYLPGIPTSAQLTAGDSTVTSSYAASLQSQAGSLLTAWNALMIESSPTSFGTISYHHAHAVRPTPIFRPYQAVEVHERLDSQRRRSGKESAFGEVP